MEHGTRQRLHAYKNNYYYGALLFVLYAVPTAAVVNEISSWTMIKVNGVSPTHKRMHYFASGELRTRYHPATTVEGVAFAALGYEFSKKFFTFVGYRGSIEHTCARSFHTNAVWQECLWKAVSSHPFDFFLRMRLFERKQVGHAQWSYQLRPRFTWFFHDEHRRKTPYIANELFINLNGPSWTPGKGLDQNRLAVGCLFIINKRFFIDLGYINQYRLRKPHNILNHIVALRADYTF